MTPVNYMEKHRLLKEITMKRFLTIFMAMMLTISASALTQQLKIIDASGTTVHQVEIDAGDFRVTIGTATTYIDIGNGVIIVDATNNRAGINVAAPDTDFHIVGSSPILKLENSAAGGNLLLELNQQGAANRAIPIDFQYQDTTLSRIQHLGDATNHGQLTFWTHDGSTLATRMTIDKDGNVGIGTAAPGELVVAQKDQNARTAIQVRNDNPGASAGCRLSFHGAGAEKAHVSLTHLDGTMDLQLANRNLNDDSDITFSVRDGTYTPLTIKGSGVTRIGTAGGANYSEFGADGTLKFVGDATVWDDLRTPVNNIKVPAFKNPAWGAFSVGQALYFTDQAVEGNQEEVYFTLQMPHSWKEGSTQLGPRIHVSSTGDDPGAIYWGLEYSWANIFYTFSTGNIIYATQASMVNNSQQLVKFTDISGAGKNISSVLMCRLFRASASSWDTSSGDGILLEFDMNYEIDTVGSRATTTK